MNNWWLKKRTSSDCKCPHELIFGTPGCGKSYYMKNEIKQAMEAFPDDKFIVFGDRWEYNDRVFKDARVFTFKEGQRINPLQITKRPESPLDINDIVEEKAALLINLVELADRGRVCNSFEVNVIYRTLRELYSRYANEAYTDKSPTLIEFYEMLLSDNSPEGNKVAMAIEYIALDNSSPFNQKVNTKLITDEMMLGKLIILDPYTIVEGIKEMRDYFDFLVNACLNQIREYASEDQRIWIFLDEMHPLIRTDSGKNIMCRWLKKPCNVIYTCATQDIEEVDNTDIIKQAGFITLFNTFKPSIEVAKKYIGLPDDLCGVITNQTCGIGLWYTGERFVPFNIQEENHF